MLIYSVTGVVEIRYVKAILMNDSYEKPEGEKKCFAVHTPYNRRELPNYLGLKTA